MKVKIIKASHESYWYDSLIGHVFDVVVSNTGSAYVLTPKNGLESRGYSIEFNDAIEVDEIEVEDGVDPDEETISPSHYESSKLSRFNLEEQLMQCWSIIDQIDTVTEGVIEYEWTTDQISNALIGIKEIYNLKFEKIFMLQETLMRSGKLK